MQKKTNKSNQTVEKLWLERWQARKGTQHLAHFFITFFHLRVWAMSQISEHVQYVLFSRSQSMFSKPTAKLRTGEYVQQTNS